MTDNPATPATGPDFPELDEGAQRAFFDISLSRALAAAEKVGRVSHDIEIAGVRIRLQFAGPRLATEFLPALAHLVVEPGTHYDAIFNIWDSQSTGVEMVRPPCPRAAFTNRGDIWGMSSKRFRSAFHFSEYSVCLLDMESGIGTYWIETAETLPYWAQSSPFRTMFSWLLGRHDMYLLHAAVVGDEDGAVLITGKGGVGKSTSSLMALTQGMQFASDDYVVVSLHNGPAAHCLYSTAKVVPEQLALMPSLRALVDSDQPDTDEKAVIYLYPERDKQLARTVPLKWIVTPRFGEGRDTSFEPVSPLELHQAAAFTTMSQLPHAGQSSHEFIGRLMNTLKSACIVLGRDAAGVPSAIQSLLTKEAPAFVPVPHGLRPLISVIIPVYNGAAFLAEAVGSILSQNYPAVEIIVVDDGSKEDIETAANRLPVDVRFFRQDNAGPASARNRGIRDASGELIAFLDVDDLWPARRLEALLEAMDETTDVVIGQGQLARIDPENTGKLEFIGNPEESFPSYIGAGLYRRSAFQTTGLFDQDLQFGEDTDWFLRAKESNLAVKRLDQMTLIVRRHGNNMTNNKTLLELNPLHVFKKALDRRRALER